METLDHIAQRRGTDKSTLPPYHGYTPFYESLFEDMRESPITLLEIGVEYGKSIRMWLDYFTKAKIVGVDINPQFNYKDPRYVEIVANQCDMAAMAEIGKAHGPLDIVIDDGGHKADMVKPSFEALWPFLKNRGLYCIEDNFVFWHPMYQSSVDGPAWLKSFVDDANWRGKHFYGVPENTWQLDKITKLEREVLWVTYAKGLTVLCKR